VGKSVTRTPVGEEKRKRDDKKRPIIDWFADWSAAKTPDGYSMMEFCTAGSVCAARYKK